MLRQPFVSTTPRRFGSQRPVTPPRPTHIHFGDGKVIDGGPVKNCHHLRIADTSGGVFSMMNLPDCTMESWTAFGQTTLTIYAASGAVLFYRCVSADSINVKLPDPFSHATCDEPGPGDPHPLFMLLREWGMKVTLKTLSVPEMTSFVPKDRDWINGPDLSAVIADQTGSHPPVSRSDGIPLWLIQLRDGRPHHVIVHRDWHKVSLPTMRSLNLAFQSLTK